MQRGNEATITRRLGELPDWTRDGDQINRTIQAPDFLTGIRGVDAVALAAERANHHPDIDIRHNHATSGRFSRSVVRAAASRSADGAADGLWQGWMSTSTP